LCKKSKAQPEKRAAPPVAQAFLPVHFCIFPAATDFLQIAEFDLAQQLKEMAQRF
jgi:hypothetical protein